MKRCVAVFSVVFLCLIAISSFGAEQKVRLVTGEWEPYTGEKLAGKGFFTEIVTAVFKEMGVEVEYSFVPWKRCEDEVLKGEAFAAFPYMKTAEREKIYDFSDVVAASKMSLFYMKSNIKEDVKWNTFSDLKKFKIGGTTGYWYEKDFKEAGVNVDYAANDGLSIGKLYLGRVDIVASEELVGWEIIKKTYPQEVNKFDTIKKSMKDDPLRLMISKKYPNSAELTEKFNKALKKIKTNGVLAGIMKKYNIK